MRPCYYNIWYWFQEPDDDDDGDSTDDEGSDVIEIFDHGKKKSVTTQKVLPGSKASQSAVSHGAQKKAEAAELEVIDEGESGSDESGETVSELHFYTK